MASKTDGMDQSLWYVLICKCIYFLISIFFRPKNGGKYCVGRRMKFKSCNTDPCSKQKKDFRDEQCAVFDGKHFNINGLPPNVRWVPKYSGSKYASKGTTGLGLAAFPVVSFLLYSP